MGRATASSWQHQALKRPESAPWHVDIPPADVAKLVNGLTPEMMEDKWFIYTDDPDSQGHATVHFYRSWTGAEAVALKIKAELDANGAIDTAKPAKMTEIVWETTLMQEAEAMQTAKDLCTYLLDCKGVH